MKIRVVDANRDARQSCKKNALEAHVEAEEGCLATPAPTLPVSLRDSRNTRVGAGLLDSQHLNVGVREEVRRKDKAWKTPQPVPFGTEVGAGFSKLFPGR